MSENMVAGMREEWSAEYRAAGGGWLIAPDCVTKEWGDEEWAVSIARKWRNSGLRVRLVCRLIFELSEVNDEH